MAEVLGKCPLCGGDIQESPKAYGCGNWKSAGCKYTIWKTMSQREITLDEAKEIIANGRTGVLEGFVSKKGAPFTAALVMSPEGKVGFEFPDRS